LVVEAKAEEATEEVVRAEVEMEEVVRVVEAKVQKLLLHLILDCLCL
jgi:hypothetical protein